MGSFEFMKKQIDTKISEGYSCIKIKIGAIDFEKECELLEYTRATYGDQISIRVDANGAFTGKDVFSKLERLSNFRLHSIEQPVQPGQPGLMQELCTAKTVPIALDEELIGITTISLQENLLDSIVPQFIVLKPTLLGGLASTNSWIRLAEQKGIAWWVTSALESNVGLNALAQFTARFNPDLPQGLGTGQLYHNNKPAKLSINKGQLKYTP
jgi:L-alanine-DL-glutamate epimerase-like enolase superfamily enzyme